METEVSESVSLSDSDNKFDMNNSEENGVEQVTKVTPIEISHKAECSHSESEENKNFTLAEKETLELKSGVESSKDDKELENNDSIKAIREKKNEKKRVVVFLKKSVLKKSQNNGNRASNEWSVDVKRSNSVHSTADQTVDDSSDVDPFSSSVSQALEKSAVITSEFEEPLSSNVSSNIEYKSSKVSIPTTSIGSSVFSPIVIPNDKPKLSTSVAPDQTNDDSSEEDTFSSSVTKVLDKSAAITSKIKELLSTNVSSNTESISSKVSVLTTSKRSSIISSTVIPDDNLQLSTSDEECLQISQTSTAEEATKTKLSRPSSPKSLVIDTAESLSQSSSATLSAPSSPQNELETSAVCNVTNMQKQDLKDGHAKQKKPVELTKSMTSLLKFTVNFDHFPTSLSMITLAKMMNLPWCQVKDWFRKHRLKKRENGFHLHNKVLKYCPYCDNKRPFINKELGQLHLYEEDHVKNVLHADLQTSGNESDKEKSSTNTDNAVMKALGFNSAVNELGKEKSSTHTDNAVMKKALGFTSAGNESGKEKSSTNTDNAVMEALGFNSVENESDKDKMNMSNLNIDNAIMKALGFISVNEIPSKPKGKVVVAGSLNDNSPGMLSHAITLPDPSTLDSILNNIHQVKSKSPKKASIPRKKKSHLQMPTSEECITLLKPLQQGWTREVVYRATMVATGRKNWDIYYRPPTGKKLRSGVEIGKYLEQKGIQDLTEENFDFSYKCLGENVSNEIIRHATAIPKPFANVKNKQDEPSYLLSTPPKPPMENKIPSVYDSQRLTQEIPGFNWLEQKIQNEAISKPSKSTPLVMSSNTAVTYNHINECNTSSVVPTRIQESILLSPQGMSTNTQKIAFNNDAVPSLGESLEKNGKENTEQNQRHLSGSSPIMGVLAHHLQTAVPIVRPSRVTALPKRRIAPAASNFQQHPPTSSNIMPNVKMSSQASTEAAVLGSNDNETGVMTGFETWHTPSLDKQNDEEQMSPSKLNKSRISPTMEQEPNDNDSILSSVSLHSKIRQNSDRTPDIKQKSSDNDSIPPSVSDINNQISLKNTSPDRPKIRIKSMLDLQDHSSKADTGNKPFALKTLASIFQFDNKNNMPTVSGIQTITAKENSDGMKESAVITGLISPPISEVDGCISIPPIKDISTSMNSEKKSSSKTCLHLNLEDIQFEEVVLNDSTTDSTHVTTIHGSESSSVLNLEDIQFEEVVINDSTTDSTHVTAIHGSESSSESCNLNHSVAQADLDNIHKNIDIVRKRKQSDDYDDLAANKRVKKTKEISESLTDENSNFATEINISKSYKNTNNLDSNVTKKSSTIGQTHLLEPDDISQSSSIGNKTTNELELDSSIENSEIEEIPAIDADDVLIDNVEILSNNDNDIRNDNDDIVELSDTENEDCNNVEMLSNNDIVNRINNDDIVELSDTDNEHDGEHTFSQSTLISSPPKSASPLTRLPPLHL